MHTWLKSSTSRYKAYSGVFISNHPEYSHFIIRWWTSLYLKTILKKATSWGNLARGHFMAQFCVMVKGPCRGKSCDFWARIRIRKTTVEDLASGIKGCIIECKTTNSMPLNQALREYWFQLGIRNLDRLCEEEPDLCAKMVDAEVLAQS